MIGILALVAVIVFSVQVYKTANGTGRNGALWALLTGVVGFGFQLVVPIMIGLLLGIYYLATGSSPEEMEMAVNGWAGIIGLPCLVLSIVSVFLIMKHVSKIPDEPAMASAPPPPPPTFGQPDDYRGDSERT
jgi:hypothetical protein